MRSWTSILIFWILVCFLSGCGAHRAAKRDLIVLLPESDGKAGAITVTNRGGSQILDKPGYAIVIQDVDRPQIASEPIDEKEIADIFGPALSTLPEPASRFILLILYFERDTTKLTHESRDLLAEVLSGDAELNRFHLEIDEVDGLKAVKILDELLCFQIHGL